MCRSSGGNGNARAVEVEPAEPEEEREIQHVWALSVCDTSGLPWDALSICDNSDFPSDESGNLLNMIMDSGDEEHVGSLADWKSLGEPVLKPAQVRLRSATGDDMLVSGSSMVRRWCDDPRSTSFLNRILVGRRDDDDKQPRFQTAWFLGLIAGSDEVIALHPDGVQRHHGEWRVSPLDNPESNLRELKNALALITDVDWRTPGCRTCQDIRYHKGWHSAECRERVLPPTVPDTMWPVASTKRLVDTGADDARDDHESKRHQNSDDTVPMTQEPSSGSGVKRSNLMRRQRNL